MTPENKPAAAVAAKPARPAWFFKAILAAIALALILLLVVMWLWSQEPATFDVKAKAQERAQASGQKLVPGYVTVSSLLSISETMLYKRGGYFSNDHLSPGALLDNMQNFEFGLLVHLRLLSTAMREDFSRSQAQSVEDVDLSKAQPYFASQNDSWIVPSSESQYKNGNELVASYLKRLADPAQPSAQFYTRADNLDAYLARVSSQLGSLSQRLSASVTHDRENTDLANDPNATQSTPTGPSVQVRTPWTKIDDNFYEARGQAYALLHILKAIEIDFEPVLKNKNAGASVRQIIRELEETQNNIWSPMILNGSGFGLLANHSLVMANYISRANAQIADLRLLLQRG